MADNCVWCKKPIGINSAFIYIGDRLYTFHFECYDKLLKRVGPGEEVSSYVGNLAAQMSRLDFTDFFFGYLNNSYGRC